MSKLSAAAVLTVLVAAGFVGAGVTRASSTNTTSFVYVSWGEPSTLDPAISYEYSDINPLQNIYETLVWYDGSSASSLKPLLAVDVPTLANGLISPDGLNYTFQITPGVMFHDGTALTAEDVEYSIERVLRIHAYDGPSWSLEQVMTDYISYFVGSTIADFQASSSNPAWMAAILDPLGQDHVITEDDVRAVSEASIVMWDDMTVVFRMTHPYAGFLSILATEVCGIVSKDFVEAHGGVMNGEPNDYMFMNTCGSGPYELVSWEMGSSITLKRFEGYHGALPSITDVQVLISFDIAASIDMLRRGEADAIYMPPEYESEIAGDPGVTLVKGIPTFEISGIAFNFNIDSSTLGSSYGGTITDDFFTDIHMRRAFSHLIDFAGVIQGLNMNAMQPNGLIPFGMMGYDASVPTYSYDLAAAQAELELSINPGTGMSWWDDGFVLPMFYNAGNIFRQAYCENMKVALESLGARFSVPIYALDWPTYLQMLYSSYSVVPIRYVGWLADYADPDNYAAAFLDSATSSFTPYTGYSNPVLEALVHQAAAELDELTRENLYHEISWMTYEDVPYVWTYQSLSFQVLGSWVSGYYYNPMHYGLHYASLEKVGVGGIEIVKSAGSPSKSAAVWTIDPIVSGNWSLIIENEGLTKMAVDVVDMTTGEQVAKLSVSLSSKKDTSTGTFLSEPVPVMAGHTYGITATPIGKAGTSATVYSQFAAG